MARASLFMLRKKKQQQQQQQQHKNGHLALLCILILLAIAFSLTNRYLTPILSMITLTTAQPPKASTFANGSSTFGLGSTSLPPISPKVSILGSWSPLSSQSAQSPVQNSAPEISEAPTVSILEPMLRSPVQLTSKVDSGACDLYNGIWVKDEEGRYPLYSPGQCPFVDRSFACQENGRRDMEYLKWRWKPHGCDLPRFNATDFLERLRGKVMMLVGDSMSRNQFGSLLCLLREALPNKSRVYEKRGHKISKERSYFTVHFPDYNFSLKYQRSYFLVSEVTSADERNNTRPTLQLDRIDKFAFHWKMADILIFNTGHWWNAAKTNSWKYFFQEGDTVYQKLSPTKAFRRALRTWAAWIEKNLTPEKNTVFYRGLGTSHYKGGAWNSGGTCNKETEPAFVGRIIDDYPWKMKVLEEVMHSMRFPVSFLNVTKLTNYRKDAHPSMYGGVWTAPERGSARREDCSHWCLPGVPDTWNELLYANLVMLR